ncbi:NAD(P)-dependent methylenetetrahydromethanopterin dehydrogenase [Methylomonas methanica]|uniref:Methylene-tetrahydromethanopterin dehydrogenase n=1 Tax=Methylomonas methanica (strain DSM 25384 / MC09) TaxID=857087 RepID=F9ZXB9_METMM|nr:NAD(P)-dependent methylenetetrahydromethanopterin dehydrogenase [Methylomonas methanica]AEF99729.1 Methylene-tetrahydromethanopterin dehydrogenase [Methylomonas methanica MC09]
MGSRILYFFTPSDNISPFDVTIAADAGYNQILPITNIKSSQVADMVQDAIFARPPKRFNDTGIFIGGRDVHLAADMFQYAKKAMVGDFKVGVFADPNGAYTTSASVVSLIEKALQETHGSGLKGRKIAVFGTGPVGLSTAVLAAQQGAETRLCKLTADDDPHIARRFCERYGVNVAWTSALTQKEKIDVLSDAEVVVCAARAGVRILDANELSKAANLLLAVDTNAVPPSGIAGIGMQDLNKPVDLEHCKFNGIGPLAIGKMKYKVQFGLFEIMQKSEKAALIDFPEAYQYALSVQI